jgi:ligand-binding sensor domain-containing protein
MIVQMTNQPCNLLTEFCRILLFVFLILVMPDDLKAIGHRPVKRFTTADGLPSSIIYTVFEDSKGFLWIGTDGGVAVYDGYKFKTYTEADGLAGNSVLETKQDRKGRIWFKSSRSGFSWYEDGKITQCSVNSELLNDYQLNFSLCISFFIDEQDVLWLSYADSKYYFKVLPENNWGKLIPVLITPDQGLAWVKLIDKEKNHWLAGFTVHGKSDSVLWVNLTGQKKVAVKTKNIKQYYQSTIRKLFANDQYLFISVENNLFRIDENGGHVSLVLPVKNILCAFEDDNWYYIGTTDGGGCYRVSKANFPYSQPEIIFKGFITGFLIDKDGGFWYSSYDDGLYYSAWPSATVIDKTDGLSSSNSTLLCMRKGVLYVGHPQASFSSIYKDSIYIHKNNILYGMADAPNGDWVIMGNSSGVVGSDDGVLFKEIKKPFYCSDHICRILYYTFFKGKLFGSSYDGFSTIDFDSSKNKDHVYVKYHLNALANINDSILILATNSGLFKYQHNALSLVNINDSAFLLPILKLFVIRGDHYLMGTKNSGLFECKGNKIIRSISIQNGLLANEVRSICLSSGGNIWVGTNRGVQLLSPQFKVLHTINSAFGLPGNEVNSIIEEDSIIYIAANLGVLSFHLAELPIRNRNRIILINKIVVDDKVFMHSEFDNYQLDYWNNSLRIEYVSVLKGGGEALQYRYRLNGEKWVNTPNTNLDLVSLSPGDYKLEIQSRLLGSEWGRSSFLSFSVSFPFWQQSWFRILILCMLVFSFYMIYRYYRKRQLIREQQRLEFTRQLEQLRLQALQAQMNPHFMFNVMGSIQHFILNNDSANASNYLTRFSRLIRNVLEQSSAERVGLDQELETLKLYLQLEALRMERFSYSIEVADTVHVGAYLIPPMIIQPFIENAIWHGLMNKSGERSIVVRVLHKESHSLVIEVEDNGIGRKAAALIKTKNNKLHNSKAMELIEKRIDALKHLYQEQISVKIIDMVAESGEVIGTKAQITVSKV